MSYSGMANVTEEILCTMATTVRVTDPGAGADAVEEPEPTLAESSGSSGQSADAKIVKERMCSSS